LGAIGVSFAGGIRSAIAQPGRLVVAVNDSSVINGTTIDDPGLVVRGVARSSVLTGIPAYQPSVVRVSSVARRRGSSGHDPYRSW